VRGRVVLKAFMMVGSLEGVLRFARFVLYKSQVYDGGVVS
jgi:hypothetical protein